MENRKKIASPVASPPDFAYTSKKELITSSFREKQSPELIEKFYKQIINSFGYAYTAKL